MNNKISSVSFAITRDPIRVVIVRNHDNSTMKQYTWVSTASYLRMWKILLTKANDPEACSVWCTNGFPTHFIFLPIPPEHLVSWENKNE